MALWSDDSLHPTEKRKARRIPISIKVEWDDPEPWVFGYARDISSLGMAIEANIVMDGKILPAVGDLLALRYMLPDTQEVVRKVGQVVRIDASSHPPCLALVFIEAQESH